MEKSKNNIKYNIGLDIGTTSVGWAVTDQDYKIMEHNNTPLYGSRIFNSALTAANTRLFRGQRRRYTKRRRRLELLQLLFQDEINKIDPNFFSIMANENRWFSNTETMKSASNNSLSEVLKIVGIEPKDFPTMYHLQRHIAESNEKVDLRLIYISIYYSIKKRGHFLDEREYSNFNIKSIDKDLIKNLLIDFGFEAEVENINFEELIEVLESKNLGKRDKTKVFNKMTKNKQLIELLKLMIGSKVDLSKILDLEKKLEVYIDSDELPLEIQDLDDDQKDLIEQVSEINISLKLTELMGENSRVDGMGEKQKEPRVYDAMISKYDKFADEMSFLKNHFRENNTKEEYIEVFRTTKQNICLVDQYLIGKIKKQSPTVLKKLKYEEFKSSILKYIKDEELKNKFENEEYLKKINTYHSSIPSQLKARDVESILKSQAKYYDFIDSDFIEKTIMLLNFKVPYYVGPLTNNTGDSRFGWLIKNNDERITPWNFENVVNKSETAERFIRRMTNKCTYIYRTNKDSINNDVLPKNSLIYQEFEVYNELNKINYIDESGRKCNLNKEERDFIIENLFKVNKEVTLKKFKDKIVLLNPEYKKYTFNGTQKEDRFASSLSSYLTFTKLGIDVDNYRDEVEEVIKILTLFNDKEIIERRLQEIGIFDEKMIKDLSKIKLSGWGRLCHDLLDNIVSKQNKTIMEHLKDGDNNRLLNLQEIITNDKFGFEEIIENITYDEEENTIDKIYTEIDELQASPAIKRGIKESIKIIEELIGILGEPEYIALEMAKEDGEKKRIESRKKKYKEIYIKNSDLFPEDYKSEDDSFFRNEKVWLYLMQGGRCLYTGEKLDINNLNQYHVDHIYPRSMTKDDGIDNKALVTAKANTEKLDDKTAYEISSVEARNHWKRLLDNKMISQLKYSRLMKKQFLPEDIAGFTKRSLVETRQIIKHVRDMLKPVLPNTKVLGIKSGMVTDLRKELDVIKNRDFNYKHHAVDAYLTSVIQLYCSKTYSDSFLDPSLDLRQFMAKLKVNTKMKQNKVIKELSEELILSTGEVIVDVKEYISKEIKKEYLMTYKQFDMAQPMFWVQTNYAIPNSRKLTRKLKKFKKYKKVESAELREIIGNKNVAYSGFKTAYVLLVEYDENTSKGCKRVRDLIDVRLIMDKVYNSDLNKIANEILKKSNKNHNVSVIRKIEIGQLFEVNGLRFRVTSSSEYSKAYEIPVDDELLGMYDFVTNYQRIFNSKIKNRILDLDKFKMDISSNKRATYTEHKLMEYINVCEKNKQLNKTDFEKNMEESYYNWYLEYCNNISIDLLNRIKNILFNTRKEIFDTDLKIEKFNQSLSDLKIEIPNSKQEEYELKKNIKHIEEIMCYFKTKRNDALSPSGRLKLKVPLESVLVYTSTTGLNCINSKPLKLMKKKK